ncbi:hypothetical protein CDAR_580141 [Caerostris darwini]|uniref:Uncharacterized protein n=1 Tax=Caerostris darwini TaxID=1538125 RepID=A0AAV4PR45_9ARAC|nr:hypothetical protein CDAR_580141 [Caerostris darwini]
MTSQGFFLHDYSRGTRLLLHTAWHQGKARGWLYNNPSVHLQGVRDTSLLGDYRLNPTKRLDERTECIRCITLNRDSPRGERVVGKRDAQRKGSSKDNSICLFRLIGGCYRNSDGKPNEILKK